MNTQERIKTICDEIRDILIDKNRKYGDSALNPCRVFAKSDCKEQIRVRIDDKLNRIKNQQQDDDEDAVMDLIGYLILYRIANQEPYVVKANQTRLKTAYIDAYTDEDEWHRKFATV